MPFVLKKFAGQCILKQNELAIKPVVMKKDL